MIAAGIDIGTNTILMVVADVRSDGSLNVLEDLQEIPRLGKGVDAHGWINDESIARAVDVLHSYRAILDRYGKPPTTCVATSAVRDAANREQVVDQCENAIGLPIRVLSGKEEAELTFRGSFEGGDSAVAVVDIGGGSTELVVGNSGSVTHAASMNIGCVRLTERWYRTRPLPDADREALESEIDKALAQVHETLPRADRLIAVAGTATALAILHGGLESYHPSIHGSVLSRTDVGTLTDRLQGFTMEELNGLTQIDHRRIDVLPAGAAILNRAMHVLEIDRVMISIRGLRYGALLDAHARAKRAEIRT